MLSGGGGGSWGLGMGFLPGAGGGRAGAVPTCCASGAWGRWRGGGGADTRCDRSGRAELRGRSSSEVATSFARTEETSWIFCRSCSFSLESSTSRVLMVSSCLLMVTMPETAAHSIDRMDPSPAEMVLRAWGERFWTSCGGRRRLSLVSVKRSERNSRGAVVLWVGVGEDGSVRRGVRSFVGPVGPGGVGGGVVGQTPDVTGHVGRS